MLHFVLLFCLLVLSSLGSVLFFPVHVLLCSVVSVSNHENQVLHDACVEIPVKKLLWYFVRAVLNLLSGFVAPL